MTATACNLVAGIFATFAVLGLFVLVGFIVRTFVRWIDREEWE